MRIAFLGSGSRGNATAVSHGNTTILIDCGHSARETARRLALTDMDPASLQAVLLTHEHTDHVRGLEVFLKRHPVPVLGTSGTLASYSASTGERLRHGETVRIGELSIRAFATSHDANEPVGYVIEADGLKAGVATDLGHAPDAVVEELSGCDLVAIEANHDVDMLMSGSYPAFLKRRILSRQGHLSNTDAADLLERIACDRLKRVVAMHLSEKNNTPMLAGGVLRERAARLGLGIEVGVVTQTSVCVCEV